MISSKFIPAIKPEGTHCLRIVVRLHHAQLQAVGNASESTLAYPCVRSLPTKGLWQTRWKLAEMGIEGPKAELPVFVTKHALLRLEQRLPLRGHESLLHNMLIDSFDSPEVIPCDDRKYLVEAKLGHHAVGYFVAAILPQLVLVKTFLFLTMHGTPVSDCLRQKLGLHRADIERYRLDDFFTLLTATDIASDPLLSRVLTECGCGHLINFLNLKNQSEWIESHGRQLREMVGLREAGNGFVVGNKWTRWTTAEGLPE